MFASLLGTGWEEGPPPPQGLREKTRRRVQDHLGGMAEVCKAPAQLEEEEMMREKAEAESIAWNFSVS